MGLPLRASTSSIWPTSAPKRILATESCDMYSVLSTGETGPRARQSHKYRPDSSAHNATQCQIWLPTITCWPQLLTREPRSF